MLSYALDVPPLPCVVDPCGARGVFDAWSWCASDVVEVRVRRPAEGWEWPQLDGHNPPGLAFVMYRECEVLPRELARLHVPGYGLVDELALAPWAIDEATDLLYEHRLRPRDVFWIAASSLEAVVWGLHDWAHFHNHGPFDQPAMTELQCDLMALAWLRGNADVLQIGDDGLEKAARDLAALSSTRFAAENIAPPTADLLSLLLGPYPVAQDLALLDPFGGDG
jgi:hypothetical protein